MQGTQPVGLRDVEHGVEDERRLGELVGELARETGTLVRQEVTLAKAEMKAKARETAQEGILVVAGAGLGVLGVAGLYAALIFLLATVLPLWFAALLVGLAFVAVGAVLAVLGVRALKRVDPTPRETLRTMNENRMWLKEQVSQ